MISLKGNTLPQSGLSTEPAGVAQPGMDRRKSKWIEWIKKESTRSQSSALSSQSLGLPRASIVCAGGAQWALPACSLLAEHIHLLSSAFPERCCGDAAGNGSSPASSSCMLSTHLACSSTSVLTEAAACPGDAAVLGEPGEAGPYLLHLVAAEMGWKGCPCCQRCLAYD